MGETGSCFRGALNSKNTRNLWKGIPVDFCSKTHVAHFFVVKTGWLTFFNLLWSSSVAGAAGRQGGSGGGGRAVAATTARQRRRKSGNGGGSAAEAVAARWLA
jgi:hypothetical protein